MALAQDPRPDAAALQASGLDHFYNLEYNRAIADFRAAGAADPQSAAPVNHLAQAEIYQEMYRIGALESQLYGHSDPFLKRKLLPPDPAAIQTINETLIHARALATAEVARDPNDAHAHNDLADSWALQGTLAFTIQKSYWSALGDAKNAGHEAARAQALNPSYVDPELVLGVHNYVAGSLPWGVRVFSDLVGYSGNRQRGREQIAYVAAHGEHARTDASVLLAVVDRRDGLNRQAAPIFDQLASQFPRNVLFAVEAAEALEAAGEHEAARTQFQLVLARAQADAPGYRRAPLDQIWYDLGGIERVYAHWQAAVSDFERVEALPLAQPHYRQAAALAAGEAEVSAGQPEAARDQFEHCEALDPATPAGKEAAHELSLSALNSHP